MLPYIALTVIGVIVLIVGIVLITRKKTALGIVMTVVGVLAALAGAFLIVCTFILIDFIHNQPPKEPPEPIVTEASVVEDITPEEPEDGGETGSDWRTWRSYTDDIVISDELTVCLSLFDDKTGYAVYDSSDGSRIASLVNDTGTDIDLWNIKSEDINGDGSTEICVVLTDGQTLWFAYNGGFERQP